MERKLLLLGMLRDNQLYGYQINEIIDAHMGSSIQITKPTAYRFLNQMAQDGWITFTEEQAGNRPTRRIYAITPDGETAFQEMLRECLASFAPANSHSAVSIAFMDSLPQEEALPLLQLRRKIIQEARDGLGIDEDHQGGFGMLITHQMRHLDTELAWLDEIIERIL